MAGSNGSTTGGAANATGGTGSSTAGAHAAGGIGTSGASATSAGAPGTSGAPATSGGAPGTSGATGAAGKGGATNAAGAAGKGGTTGAAGATGTSGATGAAGAGTLGSCTTPPNGSALVGWASQSGMGVTTTTGGGNATPQMVTTLAAFTSAVSGTAAKVIYVTGKFANGKVNIGSNKTIVGLCGAEFHGHLGLSGSSNVIIRNLKIVGYGVGDCSLDPDYTSVVGCSSGNDAVTINNDSHHIWVDHCDISDGSDGNLDITNGSDFVTVSWTKFSYSTMRTDPVTGSTGHRFSNLIGAADGLAEDAGHLNVTWHHDWWADNVAERMPRSRDGKIHVVNNLFTAAGNDYCTNSGNLSSLLVENNIYVGVKNPLQEDADGNMLSRNNVFTNTTGSKTSGGTGFSAPYALTPDATGNLEATIRAQAGPR
ncbi:MAG TPA: hypothetical protein VGP07_19605 [Polyangia bacterium]